MEISVRKGWRDVERRLEPHVLRLRLVLVRQTSLRMTARTDNDQNKQRPRQMRGFFAALRMTARTDNDQNKSRFLRFGAE